METNRDKVLRLVRTSVEALDDDQISRRTNIAPRQAVNAICRALADQGLLLRRPGREGKIVNEWLGDSPEQTRQEQKPPRSGGADSMNIELMPTELPPGDSREQRDAERVLLDLLGQRLGARLDPARLTIPSGARVEIDGADEERSVLVECWAHLGPPKAAQKHKVLSDALKLTWIASTRYPRPRLILCLSDPEAAAPFVPGARTWASAALADLKVEVVVVELPPDIRAAIAAAQNRQHR